MFQPNFYGAQYMNKANVYLKWPVLISRCLMEEKNLENCIYHMWHRVYATMVAIVQSYQAEQ